MRFPVRRSKERGRAGYQDGRSDGSDKRTAIDFLGYTEIGDLDAALVVDEDVGALDVAMYDVAFVEVVETLEDLADKVLDEGFLERAVAA